MGLNLQNRLIRHDLLLFLKGLQIAFRRPQDVALLILILLLGIGYLRNGGHSAGPTQWPRSSILGALAFWPLAFSWQRILRGRLRYFVESPLAGHALRSGPRFAYQAFAHALLLSGFAAPCALLLGEAVNARDATALLIALSYMGGVLAASLGSGNLVASGAARNTTPQPPMHMADIPLLSLVVRIQIAPFPSRSVAACGLVFASSFAAWLVIRLVPVEHSEAAIALILIPLFLMLMASGRMDYATMRILPFVGYSPASVAASFCCFPSALAGAVALGSLIAAKPASAPVAAGAGLMLIVCLVLGVARCWLYPQASRRAADLRLQIEFAALLLLLFLTPPLAAIAVVWRLSHSYRGHRRLRWQHP